MSRRLQTICVLISLLIGIGMCGPDVGAAEAAQSSAFPTISLREAGYEVRRWGIEEGLPIDRISDLAQTPDRYLWLGTSLGLVRSGVGRQWI